MRDIFVDIFEKKYIYHIVLFQLIGLVIDLFFLDSE